MPQQKRRRWRRKGMCCMPAPRPCIDSMPRRCMPHCAVCPPCPYANRIAPSSSSHSEGSGEEEKFCTVENCKNAPKCITEKLRYCPYGFKDKSGTDLEPDEARSKEMFEYQPSQEREMGAQYPQAISTPYMAPQGQPGVLPAPEFVPSGYPSVPTISSIQSRAPDQFDQSIPQVEQQLPADAAQPPIIQQDYGPTEFQPQVQERMTPMPPESQAQMQGRMMPISPESQDQMQNRMTPISLESQRQMQGRMMSISPESQDQMQNRMTPISPESQRQMQGSVMPISPESQDQMQNRMTPISPESQRQMQGRMMSISPESQDQMQNRMTPISPESQRQMQGRVMPISPESQDQMQGRMMPMSPESQDQMQSRMMPISPESLGSMQGRVMPMSPDFQPQMQSRMLPRPDTLPSMMSVSNGPNIQIRNAADQYQPYHSQPQDAMPSYDYPATRQPIPVSHEEGYVNIPRAGKQGGGYSAQYSLGSAPDDTVYSSGLPPPQFDGQKYSFSAVSSADRKPRSVIVQDEPRRMPQYTLPSEYVPLESVPTSRRGKNGVIHDTRFQQPVSETSYVRYVSGPQTSPATSERIPGSRPVSTEGFAKPLYRPPYQPDTSRGVPFQADISRGIPYQADISWGIPYQADISRSVPYQADTSKRVPYQADVSWGVPYQADTSRGVPYQADASSGVPYQADISVGTPNQVDARVGTPYQADVRAGVPYQPGIRTGAPFHADTRVGAPFQADTRMGYPPNKLAEPVIKKSSYDTQLPGSPSAPEIDSARSATMDRTRTGYQPMSGGYESTIESPPSMSRSFPSRYPLGQPLAESTSIGSSRNLPMDYSSGSPQSPATSVRTTERRSSDGLHKISYRGPSTGYNKFCKESPQPESVDKSVGFEYPLPQTEVGAPEEKPTKCPCRYPPAFKHLECTGLMSGTCECNGNDF